MRMGLGPQVCGDVSNCSTGVRVLSRCDGGSQSVPHKLSQLSHGMSDRPKSGRGVLGLEPFQKRAHVRVVCKSVRCLRHDLHMDKQQEVLAAGPREQQPANGPVSSHKARAARTFRNFQQVERLLMVVGKKSWTGPALSRRLNVLAAVARSFGLEEMMRFDPVD